jgi:GNAT superfamily N-acetyltransferase
VSIAAARDYATLNRLYESWGYHGGIAEDDVVYVAHVDERRAGLVRRTFDFGALMLRGMYVAPEYRRRGIGSELLRRFVADLRESTCYCIPFAKLTEFYAQCGFAVIDEAEAGAALRERLAAYRAEGHDVVLMRRDAGPLGHR